LLINYRSIQENILKILLALAFILFVSLSSYSQYTSPESVTYDSAYNRWLVTTSAGIKQRSSLGVVTDFAPAGSGTHGIRIYNGTAYACVGSRIKGFLLSTTAEVFNVQLTGASFLNGMGIDNSTGIAYISDFSGNKIYKLNLNTQAWWIYIPTAGGQPNGVYVDKPRNRLLVCYWGSVGVKQVSLADSSLSNLATGIGYNNLDGIYLDKYDNVYISSWSPAPSKILRYDINFTLPVAIPINSGLSNPADIFINKAEDSLAVPNSGSNTVTLHYIGGISGINPVGSTIPETFSLEQNYPNPFNPVTKIRFEVPAFIILSQMNKQEVKLTVYDVLGREIQTLVNEQLSAGTYEVDWNASAYPSGTYFYKLEAWDFTETKKMILVK
jgi:hypothetical protein